MEDVLTQLTRQFLPQMTAAEKSRALRSLKALIDAELFDLAASEGAEDDPDRACPWCGSPHYVKRGRDGRGRQRFLCRGCARTFTDATMRIFSTTKLDRSAWMRFAECHVDMLPLRESAEKCGVCLKTAFFMRHRLLEAMAKRMPAFRVEAGGGAELDECFFRESFKGNRSRSESGVPRKPRARSQGTDGHEKICVLTGINDAGDIFYEIAGRGRPRRGGSQGAARRQARGRRDNLDGPCARVPPRPARPRRRRAHRQQEGGARHQQGEQPPLPDEALHRQVPGRLHETPRELPRLVQVDVVLQGPQERGRARRAHSEAGGPRHVREDLAPVQGDPLSVLRVLDQAGEMGLACAEGHIRRGVMSRAVWRSASAASAEVVTRCKKQQLAIFFGNVETVLTA